MLVITLALLFICALAFSVIPCAFGLLLSWTYRLLKKPR
jgi:hypothetical protein